MVKRFKLHARECRTACSVPTRHLKHSLLLLNSNVCRGLFSKATGKIGSTFFLGAKVISLLLAAICLPKFDHPWQGPALKFLAALPRQGRAILANGARRSQHICAAGTVFYSPPWQPRLAPCSSVRCCVLRPPVPPGSLTRRLTGTCAVGWEPNGLGSLAVHIDSVIAHASSPAVEHAPTYHGSVSGGDDFPAGNLHRQTAVLASKQPLLKYTKASMRCKHTFSASRPCAE